MKFVTTAKSLFIFLFLFFYFILFSFTLDLLHKKECRKVSCHKCHSHIILTSHDRSHDKCGKVVHGPCSSCISSVENLMGTPLGSPCQLR